MKRRRWLLAALLLAFLWATPATAQNRIIVRTTLGLQGLQSLCLLQTCSVVGALGDPLNQLFLITTPLDPTTLLNLLRTLPGILDAELDQLLSLIGGLNVVGTPPTALTDSAPITYYGTTVWNGYANQPAAGIVGVSTAHTQFKVAGTGIVADIDTGVDPSHPTLAGVLLTGYDFTRNQAGASELNDLSPSDFPSYPPPQCSTCPPANVNQSSAAILDQSSAAILDTKPQYAAFGHGTMVLGVIHLVAPTAKLLPLKAFHSDGTGYLSNILRAIYYAVANKANVINMSFDFTTYSTEFATALNYANQAALICGASAGNDGQKIVVYPAGLQSVAMGVASTTDLDTRSSFSNYGDAIVWVAAPGEAIVTTYPFGTYAAGWGTSFSAPFVSGTSSLLLNKQPTNESQAAAAVAHAKNIGPDMGNGRLDIVQALQTLSPADFSISANPTSATIVAGQAATYTVTLTPTNGFNQTIALTCGGAPPAAVCTVNPSAVTLNGANPATATVTVQTTARAAAMPAGFMGISSSSGLSAVRLMWLLGWVAGLLGWAMLCHLGRAARPRRGLATALAMVTFSLALYSCGGNSSSSSAGPGPGTPGPSGPPASLTLSTLTLSPTSVNGGVPSTGLVTLSGPAPSGGAAVSLSSSNPSVATVPASVTVAGGGTSATFQVATMAVTNATPVTISASYNSGPQQSAVLTVTPPSVAPSLISLTLNPTSVNGGNPSTGTVTLSSPAANGGVVVSLSSSNTLAATVPASVTIAAGAASATFPVKTSMVSATTTSTISGSYGGIQQSALLTVTPPASGPSLTSLTLNPASVTGGSPSIGTVALNGPAPGGGAVVSLSSSNTTVATVPASVTIPAGATSATFTVSTSVVTSAATSTISASYNGVTPTDILTVIPVPPPGTPPGTYTITVTGTAGTLSHNTPLSLTVN
ncbi:MAG TPA: S8 family serine peptidase [Terriglobales bacterium]|nr:S8 family serine peptidase [Terriglobales bacterium]